MNYKLYIGIIIGIVCMCCPKAVRAQDSSAKLYIEKAKRAVVEDAAQAILYSDTAILHARKIQDTTLLRIGFWLKASAYRNMGSYDSALATLNIAELYVDSNDIFQEMGQRRNQANVYSGMGDHDKALKLYHNIIASLNAIDLGMRDSILLASIYINMMSIYRRSEAPRKAIQMGEEGLRYFPSNVRQTKNSLYMNMGNSYIDMEMQDSAQFYFNLIVNAPKAQRGLISLFGAHVNLAISYLAENQLDSAEKHCQASLEIAKKTGNPQHLKYAYATMAELLLVQGRFKEGDGIATQAAAYAREINDTDILIYILTTQTGIDKGLKRYEQLFARQTELRALQKQQRAEQILQAIAKIESNFNIKRRKQEQGRQEKALAAEEKILDERKLQNELAEAVVLILGVLLIFLGFLVRRRYQQQQRLRALVKRREADLYERNALLLQYAHLNSHQVRAPLSTFLALIQLLELEEDAEVREWVYNQLQVVGKELQESVEALSKKIKAQQPPEVQL